MAGDIAEIGELVPYKNGNGYFRNVVLSVKDEAGAQAFVPMTMFGTDATDLDQQLDLGRHVTCTARLTSHKYTDRNGNGRWVLSMSAIRAVMAPRAGNEPQEADPHEDPPDANIATGDPEDIPF
jgi:single-stranded DNA-binding protein